MATPKHPRQSKPSIGAFANGDGTNMFYYLADNSPNMVFINQDGEIVYANHLCAEVMGYSLEELTAPDFDFRCLLAPESLGILEQALADHANGRFIESSEYWLVTKEGQRLPAVVSTGLIRYQGKAALLGIVTDLSVLRETEKQLQIQVEKYQTVFETCPDAIVATDLEGHIVAANPAAARLRGFPDVKTLLAQKRNTLDAIVPEQRERAVQALQETLRTGRVLVEYDIFRADQSTVPVELTASVWRDPDGQPGGFVGVLRDLTERRAAHDKHQELEAQIRHAQRLESLGVLAGGIAHDFNNLLVGILGNGSLALQKMAPDDPVRKNVERITHAAERAAQLTQKMLSYSGKGTIRRKVVNLLVLVREIGHLLSASIPKGIQLTFDLPTDLAPIDGDPAQLQQLVMNLITNAAEAMETTPGTVRVEGRVVAGHDIPLGPHQTGETPSAGSYVSLSVSDHGCGMSPETRQRMFDPFFSTKFHGRGLGLAATLGIMRSHKGFLNVESVEGEGTTVRAYFPVESKAVAVEDRGHTPPSRADAPAHGRVLVVDDEEIVRLVVTQTLRSSGFEVVNAADGPEALTVLKEAGPFDLVLLDLTMPGMNGAEVFRHLRRTAPDLPVLFSSGYSEHEVADILATAPRVSFLRKPYQSQELENHVARLIRTQRPIDRT